MNRITFALALAALAGAVGQASAADLYGTDQVRAAASDRTAEQHALSAFVKPVAEPTAAGDYRAEAANATREATYRAHAHAVLAYGQARSDASALPDGFQDTVRAAAARERADQVLAREHAMLHSSPAARAALERGLNEKVDIAAK